MTRFLSALLSVFGLVSARRYQALLQQVTELRAGGADWKAKAGEAMGRARSLEQDVKRQTQLAARFKAAAEKAEQKQSEIENLQAQLEHAERELTGAREHLMVIEVKLDILEGAANVLDTRTRTVAPRRTGETGAPA